AWHSTTETASQSWVRYLRNGNAADENTVLRDQLARLQTRIMDYEEQVLENSRLRRLLGFTRRYEKKLVAAEVVSIGGRPPFQTLRISRGESDGIKVGMPVVSADGIVGKIIRAG